MRKSILKLLVMALALTIFQASAFASVWNAEETALRADHGSPPNYDDPNYDPELYWDYYLKDLVDGYNGTHNPGITFDVDYLNCSELVALLTGVSQATADLLCSDNEEDRLEGMLDFWGMMGLGGYFAGFRATLSGDNLGDAIVMFQTAPFSMADFDAYTPADFVLYKLFNDGGTLPFLGYAPNAAANADGYWCLLYADGEDAISASTVLSDSAYYMIRYWVKNNGSYDQDPADNIVLDPVALAFKSGGDDDDGDGGGCMLNATAGLSLEWLLMLLAPALLIFRRRK